jgi:hypothetical protein
LTAPTLIFGWGNPSRGDDALGPLFVEHFTALAARHPEWGAVECLTDFQLQVEHALDLQGRRRVLFVDASLDAPAPCSLAHRGRARRQLHHPRHEPAGGAQGLCRHRRRRAATLLAAGDTRRTLRTGRT